MGSTKVVGIFYRSSDVYRSGNVDRSLVVAMWWRTLVIRRDLGKIEPFFVRQGRSKLFSDFWSFAVLGVRFIWRK